MGQAVIGTNPLTTGGKGGCRPGDVGDFRGYRSRAASPPFSPPGTPVKRRRGMVENLALSRATARTAATAKRAGHPARSDYQGHYSPNGPGVTHGTTSLPPDF